MAGAGYIMLLIIFVPTCVISAIFLFALMCGTQNAEPSGTKPLSENAEDGGKAQVYNRIALAVFGAPFVAICILAAMLYMNHWGSEDNGIYRSASLQCRL